MQRQHKHPISKYPIAGLAAVRLSGAGIAVDSNTGIPVIFRERKMDSTISACAMHLRTSSGISRRTIRAEYLAYIEKSLIRI